MGEVWEGRVPRAEYTDYQTISVRYLSDHWDGGGYSPQRTGCYLPAGPWYKYGGGLRWFGVIVPNSATIIAAYIVLTAAATNNESAVNAYITGDKEPDAANFSFGLANYQSRRGTACGGANNDLRTVAQVAWDNIGAWAKYSTYQSPDITTIIQEIVDQAGWVSGNHIVLFFDDHDGRSSFIDHCKRDVQITQDDNYMPLLHIEYGLPSEEPVTFPINPVARVSGIRHVYRPGSYRLEATIGDVVTDSELAQRMLRPLTVVPDLPAFQKPVPPPTIPEPELWRMLGLKQYPVMPEEVLWEMLMGIQYEEGGSEPQGGS